MLPENPQFYGNLILYDTHKGCSHATDDRSLGPAPRVVKLFRKRRSQPEEKFPLTDENRLQFRAEFFNLVDRANSRIPASAPFLNSGARNPTAGRITETRTSAREIQFAMKFMF